MHSKHLPMADCPDKVIIHTTLLVPEIAKSALLLIKLVLAKIGFAAIIWLMMK